MQNVHELEGGRRLTVCKDDTIGSVVARFVPPLPYLVSQL
jgi:hypothetical protein